MTINKKQAKRSDKHSSKKNYENIDSDICFVIMPFGGAFETCYNVIYKPAIESCGLIPIRVKDIYRPNPIIQDIWALTKKAKIVLADLTDKNANVFYELGLAHAKAKPAVLIAQSIDEIPFDLRILRITTYDKNQPTWGEDLRMNIALAIKETIASPKETIPTTFLEPSEPNTSSLHLSQTEKSILEVKEYIEKIFNYRINNEANINGLTSGTLPPVEVMERFAGVARNAGQTKFEVIAHIMKEFRIKEDLAVLIADRAFEIH